MENNSKSAVGTIHMAGDFLAKDYILIQDLTGFQNLSGLESWYNLFKTLAHAFGILNLSHFLLLSVETCVYVVRKGYAIWDSVAILN